MIFNWARCTTTTTGTGNLTLSSVSGYPTINDVVGQGPRFTYAILDDSTGAPLEAGIGYLSASTTMVREKVTETYSSGTYDNTSPSALSLAAGTKRVIFAALTRSIMAPMSVVGSAAGYKGVSNAALIGAVGAGSYNDQDQSGRMNIFPWIHEYGGEVDAFIINCTNAGSAGQILRIGMYRATHYASGYPDSLIFESGSIDVSSTGVKTSTFTAQVLPPGHYWIACLSTSSTALYTGSTGTAASVLRGPATIGNSINDLAVAGYALSVATSAMPATCPAMTWTSGLNVPHILLRAV